MRRQTTKEPSGPATSASASPASKACSKKSGMIASRSVLLLFVICRQDAATQVVAMVMLMVVDRQIAGGLRPEQLDKGRIMADLLRQSGTTNMPVQTNNPVGRPHDQMQIMGNHEYG